MSRNPLVPVARKAPGLRPVPALYSARPDAHPEHVKRSKTATPPTAPAGAAPAHASGWLSPADPDRALDPDASAARDADGAQMAQMLGRAAHKRDCHANGHRVRPVCDDCKATWCEGCAEGGDGVCRALARSQAARGRALRYGRLEDEAEDNGMLELAAARADAAAAYAREASRALSCRQQRCSKCPPARPCKVCRPDSCPGCQEMASRAWETARNPLRKQADAILTAAGCDPRTAARPPVDACAVLRGVVADLQAVVQGLAALRAAGVL